MVRGAKHNIGQVELCAVVLTRVLWAKYLGNSKVLFFIDLFRRVECVHQYYAQSLKQCKLLVIHSHAKGRDGRRVEGGQILHRENLQRRTKVSTLLVENTDPARTQHCLFLLIKLTLLRCLHSNKGESIVAVKCLLMREARLYHD